MADLQKTIEILFSGVDGVSGTITDIEKGLSTMGSNLESFGHGLEDIGAPFKSLAENVAKVDAALAGLAVGAITLAVNEAGKFNSSIAEINTLLGLSGSGLNEYSDQVQEYAQTSTQSMDQITNALYNAASLGVGYADSLDVLESAEKLAVGTKAELNSALETLIGTMNAYGAPMSEITSYSDSFFTIIKDGKTTLPELATSIADVTGVASAAGINFDTLGAAIAAMTASGAPTSQAITKIKAAIEALLAPTPSAAKAAEELGINIGEAAIKSQGFPAVLQEIYEKTGGSAQAMGDIIPSIEGLQGALILGADKSGIFAKALEDMANKTGATTKAFTEMKENSDLIWQNMVNNWIVMLEKFGQEVVSNSSGVVSSFSDLWKAIADSSDAGVFKPITDAINAFFDDISETISGVAQNLPEAFKNVDFSDLLNALGGIGDEIKGLFDGVDLYTPEGLTKSIQSAVDALELLANVTKGLVGSFEPVIDTISWMASEFSDIDPDIQELIGTITGLGTQLSILGGIVAGGGALLSGMSAFVGFFSGGGGLAAGVSSVIGLLTGPAGLTAAMMAVATVGSSFFTGDTFRQWAADTNMAISNADFGAWADSTAGYFQEVSRASSENLSGMDASLLTTGESADDAGKQISGLVDETEMIPSHKQTDIAVDADLKTIDDAISGLDTIPSHKETDFSLEGNQASIDRVKSAVEDAAPEEKKTKALAEPDSQSLKNAKSAIETAVPGEKKTTSFLNPDSSSFSKTKSAVNDAVPESRMMEIQLQGDIDIQLADIKAKADILTTAFEWTAKLNIEQIKADAEVAAAAFDSVAESVAATASAAADMTGALGDAGIHFYEIYEIVVAQMKMEQDALNMQRDLVDAQIAYMEAKTEALQGEDALIKIDSSGLEPALEMIMWEILQKVQVRASEEASEFLLGLGDVGVSL